MSPHSSDSRQRSVGSAVVYLLFAGLLFYLCAPLSHLITAPKTAVAEVYLVQSSYILDGLIVREELPLPVFGKGAVPVANSGQAVAAGSTVAVCGDRSILAPAAGIYVTETDGYEFLTADMLAQLTPAELRRLRQLGPADTESAGKVLVGTGWLLAAAADSDCVQMLQAGKSVKLTLQTEPNLSVTATVVYISPPEQGSHAVVFRCTEQLQHTACLRQVSVLLTDSATEGLKIPSAGVYTDETGSFVYKLSASRAEKTYVNILSAENDSTIVAKDSSAHALHAGDTLILSAPNLKDGLLIY